MNIVDLLVTIVLVTILVTIVLAVVTYVAYKLRLSREPNRDEEEVGLQYFVAYSPHPEPVLQTTGEASTVEPEEHAPEA